MTPKDHRRTTEKYDAMEAFIDKVIDIMMHSDVVVKDGTPSSKAMEQILALWAKEDLIG